MSRDAAYQAVGAVCQALQDGLGRELVALYVYGSLSLGVYQPGQSDVNLIAVFEDGVNMHAVRMALRPVWRSYGPILRHVPLIATQSAFQRHLKINPVLATHLVEGSSLYTGTNQLPHLESATPVERLANLTGEAIRASGSLTPSLMPVKEAVEVRASLRSLARRIYQRPVLAEETARELVTMVLSFISRQMEKYEQVAWETGPLTNTPPLIDDLRAVYETENRLLLLLPDFGSVHLAKRINTIDWNAVADRVADQYRGLRLCTPSQLNLVLKLESAADHYLDSFDHAWGIDPLARLDVELWRVYRDLARFPNDVLLRDMPHAYVTAEDVDLFMLVHDLQNKLLNIQLRNELFCRKRDQSPSPPPRPLPQRDAPLELRIDAIYDHLDWWAKHYLEQMMAALPVAT